ncbi:hypothetical protein [Fluviicola sp.]|uniref:hypothetical protein n=1 Tax=Fluviicola sp. TaxID=1917219 RepID=UPI0031DAD331
MKTPASILALLSIIFLLTACSEKLHELTVDTSNGKTTFSTSKRNGTSNSGRSTGKTSTDNSTQYIRKGKALNIKMSNISSSDSLVLSVSEQDVRITGDEANRFQDSLYRYIKSNGATSVSSTAIASEIREQQKNNNLLSEKLVQQQLELREEIAKKNDYQNRLNNAKKQNNKKKQSPGEKKYSNLLHQTEEDIKILNDSIQILSEEKQNAKRRLDSLDFVSNINFVQNKLYYLNQKKNLLINPQQQTLFLDEINRTKELCEQKVSTLSSREIDFLSLATELHKSIDLFNILSQEAENLVFEKQKTFFPSKEEFTVSIKKYQRNNKSGQAEELVQLTFIQYQRFKIFSSIGAHCMIYNGKFAGIYSNKDSIIVRRNGSNIVPSFGTYLNGTWRLNDCLMGIALGIGIPLQFTSNVDMTPNFNILWTTNFQNQYGRFGINAGFGIQKVNVLAPGFQVGDNLGTNNLDIPLRAIWTPTFGIGISYNIGDRD